MRSQLSLICNCFASPKSGKPIFTNENCCQREAIDPSSMEARRRSPNLLQQQFLMIYSRQGYFLNPRSCCEILCRLLTTHLFDGVTGKVNSFFKIKLFNHLDELICLFGQTVVIGNVNNSTFFHSAS